MTDPVFDRQWAHLRVTRDGAVATVALDRPEARNALNTLMMQELTEVARALRLRSDVLAVILTGGARAFSAGADLGGVQARTASAEAAGAPARSTALAGTGKPHSRR